MNKILIVEDDCDLANITKIHLEHAGYQTTIASTCAEVSELISENDYDLVLLDMLLPDGDGHSVCCQIREKHRLCPIIFMSCLSDSNNIVSALKEGGDDYIVKPVKYDELLARIQSNIRRSQHYKNEALEDKNILKFKSFTINTTLREVQREGEIINLSSTEYDLLIYMTQHPDTLILYDELYHSVWDSDSLGDIRTVMVHISNLRKKIDSKKLGIIRTVRGAGYVFSNK